MKKVTPASLARYDETEFSRAEVHRGERARTLLLALLPDQVVPSHRHEGDEVILHCLSGEAGFTFGNETVTLSAGEMLFVDGANDFAPVNCGDAPCALLVTLVRK